MIHHQQMRRLAGLELGQGDRPVPPDPTAQAAVVAAIGLISYERHEATQRAVLARNVATVADVAAVPNPDLMQDFEAVRRLGQTPPADEELLARLR